MGNFNQWRANPTVNRETKQGEYLHKLNPGASLHWGPLDEEIAGGGARG
jgi:hypothetical protein